MGKRRIIESFDRFDNEGYSDDDALEYFTDLIDEDEGCEFGKLDYSLYTTNHLVFFFNDKYTPIIRWGIDNINREFLEEKVSTDIKNFNFISKIINEEHNPCLDIEFTVVGGKSPILYLSTSDVFGGHDISIPLTMSTNGEIDVLKKIYYELSDLFNWAKLCIKMEHYSNLKIENIKDIFSNIFDNANDYAIAAENILGANMPIYTIAISTGKNLGKNHMTSFMNFIEVDKDVANILSEMEDIKSHLEDYGVKVLIHIGAPNWAGNISGTYRFKDKDTNFYESQAIIIRILPKLN